MPGLRPSDLDNVESARAPITPDPMVGGLAQQFRKQAIEQLIREGHTPEEAAAIVGDSFDYVPDEEVVKYNQEVRGYTEPQARRSVQYAQEVSGEPMTRDEFRRANTPDARARAAARAAGLRDTVARQDEFERNYNDVTGAPARPGARVGSQMGPTVSQRVETPDEVRRNTGMSPYRVPDMVMPDGGSPPPVRGALMTTPEAKEYNERMATYDMSGRFHGYQESERDAAMRARGFIAVDDGYGGVKYVRSPAGGVVGMNGADGRGGVRPDLEQPMTDQSGRPIVFDRRTGKPARDENGMPIYDIGDDENLYYAPRFTTEQRYSPVLQPGHEEIGHGKHATVYTPSPELKAKQAGRRAEQRLFNDARRAGVPAAEYLKEHRGAYPELDPQDPQVAARVARNDGMQAEENRRRNIHQTQMRLGGGSSTGGPGGTAAAVNAWLMLNDPSTNDWQRAVVAGRMAPNVTGVTPLAVDAQGAANAMRMMNQVVMAEGLGGLGGLRKDVQTQKDRDAAVARAAELLAPYRNWDGTYNAEHVERVRMAVELQYPGHGNVAVAPYRIYRPPVNDGGGTGGSGGGGVPGGSGGGAGPAWNGGEPVDWGGG